MEQLVIIVGKTILATLDDKVLFSKDDATLSVEEWASDLFQARFIRQEIHSHINTATIYLSDVHAANYKMITIPAARKILEASELNGKELSNLLSSLQSKLTIQLEYGIRDGNVLSISEIKIEEKGLKCNCTCPGCGAPLVARLGKKKQRHFAHKGEACDVVAAQQTALHMLAKEIIENSKRLLFPGIEIKRDNYIDGVDDYRVQARIPQSIEYRKASIISCDSVSLERKISNIVPDIIVTVKGRSCLIEIAVTHFVDEEKEYKLKEVGLPLFEIDLSDLYNSEFSRAELTEAVLFDPNNRAWVYNPLYDEAEKWAKDEYEKYKLSAEEAVEQEDRNAAIKAEKKQQRRAIGEKKIKGVFEPSSYQKAILTLENKTEAAERLRLLHMKTDIDNLPFFLNIPISGEMVFPCDRRIWQSALFDKFVFNRNSEDENKPTIHIKRVQKWIEKYNKQFPIDWSLTYKTVVSISQDNEKTVSLLFDVIVTFFNYLVYLGFLEPFYYQEALVRQTHSFDPPNKDHAEILLDAINKVDWYDPAVDDKIMQFLSPVESAANHYLPRNRTMILNEVANEESIIPKTNWEDRKKEIECERATGLADVQERDFDGDDPVYDSLNWRWLKCTSCEKLLRADQMASYGGPGSINKGLCRDCSNKRR
jgi:hypothetical protein